MDRSYLSAPAVVTASREFVCVRTATYEDEAEGAFAQSVFRGREGLENTVFTLLAPDGKTPLTGTGRSPRMVFGGQSTEEKLAAMVASMESVAKRYADEAKPITALPTAMDLRRGLNVAACDLQPIVVLVAATEKERERARKDLAKLAWSEPFVGECQYAVVSDAAELAVLEGVPDDLVSDGELGKRGTVLFVQPDEFGLKGKVLAHAEVRKAKSVLEQGLAAFVVSPKNSRDHVRAGRRQGAAWEPVLEPEEKAPRRRERDRRP